MTRALHIMNEALEARITEIDNDKRIRAAELAARLTAAGKSNDYVQDVLTLLGYGKKR